MSTKFLLLFYCCCIPHICRGEIWKTEEAYIIDYLDDLPADSTTDNPNECKTSSGAQGQCVTIEECGGHEKFFLDLENIESKLFTGLQQYLNGTDLEPCTPKSQNEASPASNFVCCTSLKYANVRNVSFEEYNANFPNKDSNESLVEIPQAITRPTVVNGDRASPGEFPYAVAIIYNGRQVCGGSLIGSQWVVSAAHCFDRFNSAAVRSLLIKVGDDDISNPNDVRHQDVRVEKLFLHPGFFRDKGYFRDDIALIKLRTQVTASPNIQTVALYSSNSPLDGIQQVTVCGWGKTCDQSCPTSSVLLKANLQLMSKATCSQRYAGTQAPPITDKMICAGGARGKDSCNGDSGGPLVTSVSGLVYQVGIVSWGIGCGQYPGVYTRVSSFVNWVRKHQNKF